MAFNRLDTTSRVFESVRSVRPGRLYLACDGPRDGRTGESEKVVQLREHLLNGVDWDCHVKTLFRDDNLGCKDAVSGALDWFFQEEEEGIILEDDTLPSTSFYRFCDELLDYYRDDNRVMKISGFNNLNNPVSTDWSYYFTSFGYAWGWATWRRFWKTVDIERIMELWPKVKEYGINRQYPFNPLVSDTFDKVYADSNRSYWHVQTELCRVLNHGLSIVPARSLVCNIGFGGESTHTSSKVDPRRLITAGEMPFPLSHPEFISPYAPFEKQLWFERKNNMGLIKRLKAAVKRQLIRRIIHRG